MQLFACNYEYHIYNGLLTKRDAMPTSAAVIIGAGDATGGAIARAFAAEGLPACVTRRARHGEALEGLAQSIRDAGQAARAFPADARDEAAMTALFDQVEAEVGPVEVAVFNVGANYAIDTHWGVAFSLSWIPMKTTATLTTRVGGNTVGVARTRVRLDPIVPYLYLTYRF